MNLKWLQPVTAVILIVATVAFGADQQKDVVSIRLRLNNAYQYWIEARLNGSDPTAAVRL
jgi:hypothetical protein